MFYQSEHNTLIDFDYNLNFTTVSSQYSLLNYHRKSSLFESQFETYLSKMTKLKQRKVGINICDIHTPCEKLSKLVWFSLKMIFDGVVISNRFCIYTS